MLKLFNRKYSTFKKDQECDVLIIGNNLTSALTAYKLLKYNLKLIIVDNNQITGKDFIDSIVSESYDFNQLNISINHKLEKFKEVLGTAYELDEINQKLKNKIDYERNPNISYKKGDVETSVELLSGVYYDFGIKINKYKLFQKLIKYLRNQKVNFYMDTEVVFYSVDNKDKIVVVTNNGYKVKCRQVINTLENNIYAKDVMLNKDFILNNVNLSNNILDNLIRSDLIIKQIC